MKKVSESVYLIESDPTAREELMQILNSCGFEARGFESAADYFAYMRSDLCACLIVEMQLSDTNGLELQRRLEPRGAPPIIFISDGADVQSAVAALKAGAVEFLIRPFRTEQLREAVELALEKDRAVRQRRSSKALLEERFRSLTPRQREAFPLIIAGLLNKQSAAVLNISEVTLQIHRRQIMRKMKADSLAELVRMAMALHIPHWQAPHNDVGPGEVVAVHPDYAERHAFIGGGSLLL
jgi:FixJ family two-component response regulator